MKPSEIWFYKSYGNASRYCTRNEFKASRSFTLLEVLWNTKQVIEALKLKGQQRFCSSNSRQALEVTFKIEFQEPQCLKLIGYRADRDIPFGSVTLQMEEGLVLHNKPCSGAIVVDTSDSSQRKLLESFALAVGLYWLVQLEGDWEKSQAIAELDLESPLLQVEELQTVLQNYRQQLQEQEIQLQELQKSYNVLKHNLEYQLAEYQKRITALTLNLRTYQRQIQNTEQVVTKIEVSSKMDFVKILKQLLQTKRMCVVGGKESWQAKIMEEFPETTLLESKNFSPAKMNNCDILVINTNSVGHSLTSKAQNIANLKNMRLIFTSKHNMQKFAEEVLASMN